MQTPDAATQWTRHWLYDWGGANVDLFLTIQRALPDGWIWLPEILSLLGSYWGAPAVVVLMLVWRRMQVREGSTPLDVTLCRFVLGLALAFAGAAIFKAMFALPRPFVVLGDAVYRAHSAPDSRYTMPSGHSVYVGVLAAALWPALGWAGRIGLLVFAAAVGWSRLVLGAHFPMDVIAGLALGGSSAAAADSWAQRLARCVPMAWRRW
ncbi:membrane-associated phospholipid phosphatase [Acidovorax soli]|uniref:Membrane-associated phospholipid phosphatase n=1 Tax=Acidovorax soli TaxID=592050 RepID=A0A7X0U831_9BURK|nr:phosphatase PAP2 family protein [Acidovorax soli]MBB6558691.1 membrane-associated phospholipid phosphatase [Acidovorax soli]